MNITRAWRYAALLAFAGSGIATSAFADDKIVKIGVLTDMSSLYADINGPNAVVAVKMAVEDSGLPAKGWKIEVLSGDQLRMPLRIEVAGFLHANRARLDPNPC